MRRRKKVVAGIKTRENVVTRSTTKGSLLHGMGCEMRVCGPNRGYSCLIRRIGVNVWKLR